MVNLWGRASATGSMDSELRYWPEITQIDKYNSLIPENQIPVLSWPNLDEDEGNCPDSGR
jgi:hypothetical protein